MSLYNETKIDIYNINVIKIDKAKLYFSYYLTVKFEKEITFKIARSFMIIKTIEHIGEIIMTDPPMNVVESGDLGHKLSLVVVSKQSKSEVLHRMNKISEIIEVQVQLID